MPGIALYNAQIDSKSGVLTLFRANTSETRSVTFDVGTKPYSLVAYNLIPGQIATLYNVAQLGNDIRESIFQWDGHRVELTYESPVGIVALTGTYRLVFNQPNGVAIVKAYPQEIVPKLASPVQSDIVNSIALKAGEYSPALQVLNKPYTVAAYDLITGNVVSIFNAYDNANAYYGALTPTSTVAFLDRTGEYRFLANVDCLLTLRPNYIDFKNPYINKGDKGDTVPAIWGNITGTLSNQTDLQTQLDLKAPKANPVFTGLVSRAFIGTAAAPTNTALFLFTNDTVEYGNAYRSQIKMTDRAGYSSTTYDLAIPASMSTQAGNRNFQMAYAGTQNGFDCFQSSSSSTQTGGCGFQSGAGNTQSGYSNTQSGYYNTQSGYNNFQKGHSNTQSGQYGFQSGKNLANAGFDYTVMFGHDKTTTVAERAYFALDNGIWIKPVAGDAASPENGVLAYNSTLGAFRAYASGAWQTLGAWGGITGTLANQTDLQAVLDLKAPKADPVFTGLITANDPAGFVPVNTAEIRNARVLITHSFVNGSAAQAITRIDDAGNISSTNWFPAYSSQASTQSGYGGSLQLGFDCDQIYATNSVQVGGSNTQSGYYQFQVGQSCTQTGYSSFQRGYQNTQTGQHGFQSGATLNDGGFNHTFMVGSAKTAAVTKRAYFALDNGIWIKPFAGDAASPENGVIAYNSTLNALRAYTGGAWHSLAPTDDPAFTGVVTINDPPGYTPVASTLLTRFSVKHSYSVSGSGYENIARIDDKGNFSNTVWKPVTPASASTQAGYANFQTGRQNTQSGFFNTQSGYGNTQTAAYQSAQSGFNNVQSCYQGTQSGYGNTQSGAYNTQAGYMNVQTGKYGTQNGFTLNDGGFNHTTMFGHNKTATVGNRAYFALDNGIWIKPVAGDAASPENGVICYNSTLNALRAYINGAWKTITVS